MRRTMSSTYHGRRGMYNDAPVVVDMEQSIREMRQVYSSLTDIEFIHWYANRFRFHADDVAEMLERIKKRQPEG